MKARIFKSLFLGLAATLVFTACTKRNNNQSANKNDIPQSIVSLAPASTEILFAVGAGNQVAAISQFTDYPPEALALPEVGGFDGKTLSLEKILSFKPDLVYLTDGMHNFLIESLDQYGIKYYLSKADSVKNVINEILEIGKITGHEKQAKSVAAQIENTISKVNKQAENSPSVYYEVWTPPYMTAGSESFINDVIACAGGKNIFGDIAEAYPIISEETLIARAPEVILIPATSGITAKQVAQRTGWENIPAVKNNRIYIVDDNLITRAGPRIGEAIKAISDIIN